MKNRILRTLLSLLLFIAPLFVSACDDRSVSGELVELKFENIELADSSLSTYPFLKPLREEIEEQRRRFPEWIKGDLRHEGEEFEPPTIRIAHTKFNDLDVSIWTFGGGSMSFINCGNAGCGHMFYVKSAGTFQSVGSQTFNKIFEATCTGVSYFIIPGGPGAGVTRPLASAWAIPANKLERLGPLDSLEASKICSQIETFSMGEK